MKVFTRNNSAINYECEHCGTVLTEADLAFEVQHSALGKYTVRPDVADADCPFCHRPLGEETERIELKDTVDKDMDWRQSSAIRKILDEELQYEETQYKKAQAEGVPVHERARVAEELLKEELEKLRQTDIKALSDRQSANSFGTHVLLGIMEAESALNTDFVSTSDPLEPYRTKVQNCLSHGHTIKPQIDWEAFDKDYGHLVRKV